MSRHVPRRRGDPHPREFDPLAFHGWYECRGCSAVVVDWARHQEVCHVHEDQAEEPAGIGADAVAARAQAEGSAVVGVEEFAQPRMFGRETWRQVAACLRLRPAGEAVVTWLWRKTMWHTPKDTRPAAVTDDPPAAAGRAEQWAAMDGLIKRTTEA